MLPSTENRGAASSPWRRLGKIKLGIKVKNEQTGKEYPTDLDYFVVPDNYKDKLGDKPKELFIVLPNPMLEQNFTTKAAVYRSNGAKWCSTQDDVHAKRFQDTGRKTVPKKPGDTIKPIFDYCQIGCPAKACEYRQTGECKERGFFNFMIPAVDAIGTFLLRPTSQVGITNIYTVLKVVESYCARRPNGMAGIRLRLYREPQQFFKDIKGDGQLAAITKYIVNLELDWKQLLQDDQRLFGPILGKTLALPAAHVDEAEEVDEDDEKPVTELMPFGDLPPGFHES